MTESPQLTITILSYNRRFSLERTIYQLYATTDTKERKIIIWDNSDDEQTISFLRTLVGQPNLRIIHSRKNVGTNAISRLLPLIDTPYLMTIDHDIWILTPGWVNAMTSVMDAIPSLVMLRIGGIDNARNNLTASNSMHVGPFFYHAPLRCDMEISREEYIKMSMPFLKTVVGENVFIARLDRADGSNFGMAGCFVMWRMDMVRNIPWKASSGFCTDLCSVWPQHILQQRPEVLVGSMKDYLFYHAWSPFWHIGREEVAWEKKCEGAPVLYGDTTEHRRAMLEETKKRMGYYNELEDADVVAPEGGVCY